MRSHINKLIIIRTFFVGIIIFFFLSINSFSQCPSIAAGNDQTICSGSPANLTSTYNTIKATTSYTVAATPYAPNSFTAGALALATNKDDYYGAVFNIGFCFTFFGNQYTQCVVGANGALTFNLAKANQTSGYAFSSSDNIPSTSATPLIGNAIFGPVHDMDPSIDPGGGLVSEIRYIASGVAPCRTFTVSWSNVPMYSSSCNNKIANQQIVLYETSNIIDVFLKDKPLCSSWNGGNATLGIQNSNGTIATVVPNRNSSQWSATNEGWRFLPDGATVGTVQWLQGATVLSSSTTATVNPLATTTYTAKLTTTNCGLTYTFTDDVIVNVNPTPTVSVNSTTICSGGSATLTAIPSSAGGTFLWSNGATGSTINVSPSATTTYSVVYTLGGCSSLSMPSTVTVTTAPTVTVNNTNICSGGNATLTATPSAAGGTYLWSNGSTSSSITVSLTANTSYSVVYTLGCPSPSASGTVTVNAIPTVTVSSSTICEGGSATITATPSTTGGTFLWEDSSTGSTLTVSPTSTTTYSVIYTLGCPGLSASGTVTVNSVPTVTVNSSTICNGASATLTATPSASGGTYLWSNASTGASLTVSPSSTTTYSVVYSVTGCSSLAGSGTITVNPIPTVSVNSQTVCAGSSATLTATPSIGGGTYLWNTGETGSELIISPSSTTTYSVVYTFLGCSSLAGSGTITVKSIPTVVVNSSAICSSGSATLTATPSAAGGTFLWNTGGTGSTLTVSPGATTTYTVVYSLAGCSSIAGSGTVTLTTPPSVTVSSETICSGASATLTATPTPASVGGTYLWSNGTTGATLTVSPGATTSYSVVYTFGCPSASASGTVTVNSIPTISSNSQTVCEGIGATLTATPSIAGGTYLWNTGETGSTLTITPVSTTIYTVIYTFAGCPSLPGSGTVTVKSNPTVTVNSTTICPGGSATLNALPSETGGTYLWSNSSTTSSINVSPSATTTYSVVYTSSIGCVSLSGSGSVTLTAVPTVTVNSETICNGVSATLTATPSLGGGTFLWSNASSGSTLTVSPNSTTSYTVVYTLGCSSAPVSGTVTVSPGPTVTVNSQTICSGASATLTATPSVTGGTYLWSNSATADAISVSPSVNTTYSVIYTLAGCSSLASSGVVTVNSLPIITITPPAICIGGTATLTATPAVSGGTYLWSDASTGSTLTVSPLANTAYSVVYTLSGCSSLTATGTVVVTTTPTVTVSSTSICNGSSATLTATPSIGNGTYLWSNGTTGSTLTVSPNSTTSYSVVYDYGCPSLSASGTVTVNQIPTVAVNSQTVCNGVSATLTASPSIGGGTYLWSDASVDATLTVSPSTTTSYTVIYTYSGCSSLAGSGTVNVNPIPTLSVNSPSICPGNSTTLTAIPSFGGGTFMWNNASTASSLTVSPLANTSYSVIYTSFVGCSSIAANSTVTLTSVPTVTVNSETVCSGTSATLTATPSVLGGTYLWNNSSTGSSITVSPGSTTSYSVIYTFVCPSISSIGTITVNPTPTVSVNSNSICNGASSTLTAIPSIGGGTYLWNNSSVGSTLVVSPSSTTTYSVIYTLTGCSSLEASGVVTVNPIPVVTVNSTQICPGGSSILTATPTIVGGSFLWDDASINSTLNVSPLVTTPYTVVYTSLAGCESLSALGTVTVTPVPTVTVNSTTVCNGTSAILTATPSIVGGTFVWNNSSTGSTISVTPSTTTSYSVIYTFGCPSLSVSGTVNVNPIPSISVSSSTICNGSSATLTTTPSLPSGTYLWNDLSNGSTLVASPNSTTTYSVVYTLSGCSSLIASGVITVNPIPDITVNSTSICSGQTAVLTTNTSIIGGTFLWSDASTDASLTATLATSESYSVIYTFAGCSSIESSGTITVNQLPIVTATPNFSSACEGTQIILTAGGASTYSWTNGLTDAVAFTPSVGTVSYNVVGTDINNCQNSASTSVVIYPLPIVEAGNSIVICTGTSVTLNASGALTYTWDNGVTDGISFIPPIGTLNYTVTGIDINGCSKTDVTSITVNPLRIPQFGTINEICQGTEPPILSISSNDDPIINGSWDIPLVDTSIIGTTIYTFTPIAGECAISTTLSVTINPLPILNIINPPAVCTPDVIDLTDPRWTNGSSGGSLSFSTNSAGLTFISNPTSISKSGIYFIESSSAEGCSVSKAINIVINSKPMASFSAYPNILNSFNTIVHMDNKSIGADSYSWSFADGDVSDSFNPSHSFPQNVFGEQIITLIVKTNQNCSDTTFEKVVMIEELIYLVPNTFTPDADQINQTFKPVFTEGYDPFDFTMVIYNRWGEVVFKSHDVNEGWSGTYGVDGEMSQDDSYTWKIDFKIKNQDKRKVITGVVNLIR